MSAFNIVFGIIFVLMGAVLGVLGALLFAAKDEKLVFGRYYAKKAQVYDVKKVGRFNGVCLWVASAISLGMAVSIFAGLRLYNPWVYLGVVAVVLFSQLMMPRGRFFRKKNLPEREEK